MKRKKYIVVMLATAMFISGVNTDFNRGNPVSKAKEKVEDFIVMATGTTDLEKITEEFNDSEQVVSDENIVVCEMTESEAKELQKSEEGIIVEKDSEIFTSSKNFRKQKKVLKNTEWNMKAIHAEKAGCSKTEDNIKVAVIDSGVDDYNDIELAGSINLLPGEEDVSPLYVDVTGL